MPKIENVIEVYKFMDDKNIVFAYTGTFDHTVTTALLKQIKNKLGIQDDIKGVEKKIYNLLVECIENMSRHAFHEKEHSNGIFLLCKQDGKYVIITGNNILNENIPTLKEKLDKVSGINIEELKKMYREQIMKVRTSEMGAGLGLIDIAIKSGNKLQYHFKERTELMSFYLFQTEININSI